MTKAVQTPALHIFHNGDADLYNARVRENNIYFDNGKIAKFNNSSVLTVHDFIHKKGVIRKRTTRFKAVIYLDGKGECADIMTAEEIAQAWIQYCAGQMDLGTEKQKNLKNAWKNNVEKPGDLQKIPDSKETLIEPLTDQDREVAVKRMILKALAAAAGMKTWMFLVIIALEAAGIVISFLT